MKKTPLELLSLTFTTICFLTNHHVSADLITKTCQKTPYYSLCITTLKSDSQSSKANLEGLAHIAATKLQAKTSSTSNQINNLLKQSTSPEARKGLSNCADAYNIIVKYDMPEAMEAITKGDPKFAEDAAIDVGRESDDCGKGISSGSPLASDNKFVHDLSAVFLSIVRMLL